MSYNKTKCQPNLGQEVEKYLIEKGVQTPTIKTSLSRTDRIDKIEHNMKEILETLGMDLSDDSLIETPKRVAKMYVNEIFWGLDFDAFPKCTTVENKFKCDEMVQCNDITLYSDCEHHLRPLVGKISIAYIPKDKIMGLSKFPRVCEFFSRRPQIQERLTLQIFYALEYILDTNNIAITIKADHMCVAQRGVEDSTANTITSKLGGVFKTDIAARAEFFSHVKR